MATTGELRAIIDELELVDIGDAANYLGEEADNADKTLVSGQTTLVYTDSIGTFGMDTCSVKQQQSA